MTKSLLLYLKLNIDQDSDESKKMSFHESSNYIMHIREKYNFFLISKWKIVKKLEPVKSTIFLRECKSNCVIQRYMQSIFTIHL